jgi:hypothetical protein
VVRDESRRLEDHPPPPGRGESPFDNIEGAHEYVGLLAEAIAEAEAAIREDIEEAQGQDAARRAEALRIVAFKLDKLRAHIGSSHRILNDLRTLRRLLLQERPGR